VGDKISSICLPDQRLKLPEGHKCYAAGWGATAPDSRPLAIPSALMQFFTSILPPTKQCGLGQSSSNRRCKSAKQPLKLLEVELPLDTCRGDSGGGLFCQNPKDGRWHIYGITSFGSVHGCGKHYGVYTCTRGIAEWIHENVV
ncbi:unnamed protein product, partial [Rodentolepis nana]|uniref:Peptidase S1 domain-containing protein n=1 Tax=Rodentolepis nana TaxID=102285 RepID=A0A0R3THG7_RODNA